MCVKRRWRVQVFMLVTGFSIYDRALPLLPPLYVFGTGVSVVMTRIR